MAKYRSIDIYDVSTPSSPSLIGNIDLDDDCSDLVVHSDYLYVGNWSEGLGIYDISDPSNLVKINNVNTQANVQGVSLDDNYAYIADGLGGVLLYDISDPVNPVKSGFVNLSEGYPYSYNYDYYAIRAFNNQKFGYIACSFYGFIITGENSPVNIMEYPDISENTFTLKQNFPNPFYPTTEIKYQLKKESNVKLSVYDNLGRELKVLVDQKQKAGTYNVLFDATNYNTGMYICNLQVGSFSDRCKMLILR